MRTERHWDCPTGYLSAVIHRMGALLMSYCLSGGCLGESWVLSSAQGSGLGLGGCLPFVQTSLRMRSFIEKKINIFQQELISPKANFHS